MKIIILGAGLAGLSAAYHLDRMHSKALEYHIYEQEDRIGGLCCTEQQDGFFFDYTGHLLHLRTDYVKALIHDLLGKNLHKVLRNASIYSHGGYTPYPFQANLHGLPDEVVRECVDGFLRAEHRNEPDTEETRRDLDFRTWVKRTFGSGIAKHFMIPYNGKLWNVDLGEMTCDWMGRYVPQPTAEEVIQGARSAQGTRFGYNAHFYYPLKGGIQVLADTLAVGLTGRLHLRKEATAVDVVKKRIEFSDGEQRSFDALISTIPLKKLILMGRKIPADIKTLALGLRGSSVLDINVGINRPRISDHHWIYFPEPSFVFYRVGFPMNFSPFVCPPECSSMYVEVAFNHESPVNIEQTVQTALDQLRYLGFMDHSAQAVSLHVRKIHDAYPVYDRHRRRAVPELLSFLGQRDIHSLGRYGAWEYSAMEDAILQGRQIAEKLTVSDSTRLAPVYSTSGGRL